MGEQVTGHLNVSAYVIFAQATIYGQVSYPTSQAGWLNLVVAITEGLATKSHSMNVAHRKLGELLDGGMILDGEVVSELGVFNDGLILRTPRTELEFNSGCKGGVRIGPYMMVVSKLASPHDQLLVAMMFAASMVKIGATFSRVIEYQGGTLVVLKSPEPKLALEFIAWICQRPIDIFGAEEVMADKSIIVHRTDSQYGPAEITVVVEVG